MALTRALALACVAMTIRPGTVERAFELARDSQIMTVEKIRRRLKAEGYVDWEFQLSGREIRRQLQAIVVAKRKRVAENLDAHSRLSESAGIS